MEKVEGIEDFYKRKFDWMPDNVRNDIGHFNVFTLEPFASITSLAMPLSVWISMGNGIEKLIVLTRYSSGLTCLVSYLAIDLCQKADQRVGE